MEVERRERRLRWQVETYGVGKMAKINRKKEGRERRNRSAKWQVELRLGGCQKGEDK